MFATEILNASILIVDDQQINIHLLEKVLQKAGYTNIDATTDSRTVYAMHQAKRYDLILLDLQMPGLDGFEVMEALKAIETDGYLPVLVVTAQPAHKLRALQAGAKDFVSKPFDLVEVQMRIRNMLEVRLLYRQLSKYSQELEQAVQARTAELRASEERFKCFTELSTDWYWEQDAQGKFIKVSGPVFDMLGISADHAGTDGVPLEHGWDIGERAQLDANIASRRPFLDFVYHLTHADGDIQYLQVSGEPMFDTSGRFAGYRGVGTDITARVLREQKQLQPAG